ncbi:SusC/RagA family TonB-linked outer membrane protein [Maribellus maritimus]|uniref:SusC/RagA family TonB-linked outer membrane protein n=1 Tax=Maribellus maritimus TaxID=2870838 RepID=UPI001EEB267E|nr:TonB-dependent receptor [Maribellus maritimus]MCG6186945.1 TonB-dependent receptor [Maribellus maritimus]
MKKKRINERWAWPGGCFKKTILIMRLSLILILFSVLTASASVYSQSTKISLDLKDVTITEAFNVIENQTYFRFVYDDKLFNDEKIVTLRAKERNIEEILHQIFPNDEVSYKILEDNLIVFLPGEQSGKAIKGNVVDEKGEPLPGVTVLLKGTMKGTVTNGDGNFNINVDDASSVLVFSFVGFESTEVEVGNRTAISVKLQPSVVGLEEVIAIGYGTQKKRDIIGSISTITSDEILKTTDASSFDAALQGMAPGLMVSSESGVPGAPVQIKIRGVSSISSGTDPLWIVDGIPIVSGSAGRAYDGETSQNVMSLINPSDIESIQVLKDAAATSIYGSRGSNGVILVTTKSGKKGKMSFNVDLKSGVSNWANRDIGLASGSEYIEIMDRAYANSGLSGVFDPQISLNQLDGMVAAMTRDEALATDTDWGDLVSRTGSFVEANVSATQGTEKGNSYLSLRYRKDNSIIKYSDLETISVNSNLNYNLFDAFKLNYRGFVSFADNNRVKSKDGKGAAGGWAQVNAYSLPWMKVYDDTDTGVNGFWNPLSGANALAGISPLNSESNLQTLNVLQGLNGTLQIVEGLTVKGEFGANLLYNKGRSWRGDGIRIDGAIAKESKDRTTVLNYNTFFNYDKTFGEDHWLNVVAGVENTRSSSHYTYLESEALVGSFHEVGKPESIKGYSYLGDESYLRGYFGRANYKFKDKYIVGGSIRRDGISKFTSENRWATFASGSAGWIISEEDFFKSETVSMLKLRGSYGQTGNTNIPSGITSDYYSVRTSNTLGIPSTEFVSVGNSDIKWETTSTLDFGVDYGLFNNRINGSLAYYVQTVEDMLLAVALPYSAGISGGNIIWQNVGDMENRGVEFNVDANILNGVFKWDLAFNASYNKNKIKALDPESDANNVGITQMESSEDQVITIFKTGLPLGNWYMAESAGVDPEKGIPMIYEVQENEDGTTSHTGNIIPATSDNLANNRMILDGKTSLPKFVGGFNSRFAYKSFDVAMNFSFAAGNYIYNRLLQSTLTPNRGVRALSNKLLTDAWQNPGDNAKWPRVVMNVQHFYDNEGNPTEEPVTYGSEEKFISSMYLEKGDYLKLKNLSVGYTLPVKIASKMKMQSMRVALNVTNLFTLTKFSGYDPEVGIDQTTGASLVSYSSIPQARTYSLGLNINF